MLSQTRLLVAKVMLTLLLTWGAGAQGQILLGDEVLEHWRAAAAQQTLQVDHSIWSELLSTYLDDKHSSGINRFDYKAVTASDRKRLSTYIDYLSALPVSQLTPKQQMAFWINLYNVLTVRVILDNPGVSSIREIKSGWFSLGPWGLDVVEIDDIALTLDDIEHRILRPIFGDPRIHFAVNCASLGCPNLSAQPFLAATLEQKLEKATKEFVNHPRGATISGETLTLSSLLKWYGDDFGETVPARLKWLAAYSAPTLAEQLENWDGRIRYEYDWGLNAPP